MATLRVYLFHPFPVGVRVADEWSAHWDGRGGKNWQRMARVTAITLAAIRGVRANSQE
jgi:hypothetical protein